MKHRNSLRCFLYTLTVTLVFAQLRCYTKVKKKGLFDDMINRGNTEVAGSLWMKIKNQRSDDMGIGINVNSKQDYSYLFRNLPGSGGSMANLNFLSDYASIKNGSYGKLMKAYYGKSDAKNIQTDSVKEDKKNSISTAADSAKTLSGIEKAADGLKNSADALIDKGSKSVFNKKDVTVKDEYGMESTSKEYDKDAIYKAVSQFTEDYNKLLTQAGDSKTKSVMNRTASLVNMTQANKNLLSQVGITIKEDNTLSLNEEAFKKADMSTAKSLFNGNGSYAYQVSARASLIDFAASTESAKANTYTGKGNYSNPYTSGNMMDALF